MEYKLFVSFCLLIIGLTGRSRFVDTAPLDTDKVKDEPVKELESLKHSLDKDAGSKEVTLSRTHTSVFTEVNGQKTGNEEIKEQINKNDEVVAKVEQKTEVTQENKAAPAKTHTKTEIDVPSKGIHKTLINEDNDDNVLVPDVITNNGERRSFRDQEEKFSPYSGVEYSPLDMAEYIFWTGDERGVTLAIEEFLQEGLMSREEAINFLQEIKSNLDHIQNHYQKLVKVEDKIASKDRANLLQKTLFQDKYRPNAISGLDYDTLDNRQRVEIYDDRKPAALFDISKQNTDLDETPLLSRFEENRKRRILEEKKSGGGGGGGGGAMMSDEDYEELLERLRVADFLYTEYSLEEVIYQLAKVMFSQSLTRGSLEAQRALQKFTTFLEREAEQGHISRSLEKKILDVLIASLTDTLTEHPELVAAAKEGLGNIGEGNHQQNKMLKELLMNAESERTASKSGQFSSLKSDKSIKGMHHMGNEKQAKTTN